MVTNKQAARGLLNAVEAETKRQETYIKRISSPGRYPEEKQKYFRTRSETGCLIKVSRYTDAVKRLISKELKADPEGLSVEDRAALAKYAEELPELIRADLSGGSARQKIIDARATLEEIWPD